MKRYYLWRVQIIFLTFILFSSVTWGDEKPTARSIVSILGWSSDDAVTITAAWRQAQQDINVKNYTMAHNYYKYIVKHSKNEQNRASATIGQAFCFERVGDYHRASKHYKQALDKFRNLIPFHVVLLKQFNIATTFFKGRREGFLFLFLRTDYKLAIRLYEHIVQIAPSAKIAPTALYRTGILLRQRKKYLEAIQKFQLLRQSYPQAELAGDALIEEARTRLVLLSLREKQGNQSDLNKLNYNLNQFIHNYPKHSMLKAAHETLEKIREKQAEWLLYLGEFYSRPVHSRVQVAKRYLNKIILDFPLASSVGEAKKLLSQLDHPDKQNE